MSTREIFRLPPTASVDQVVEALEVHGHVVLEGLAEQLCSTAATELAPFLSGAPTGAGEFTGCRTQRVNRLIARSAACREMATLPLVQDSVARSFRGSCYHAQLALTQCIRIHPGESAQALHRDDNTFFLKHPRPPAVINSMWALSDFTCDNGATRLIPGSHRWNDAREPTEAEAVAAVMPRGSLMLWDGGLYHGGGANQSRSSRTGIILAYNLGWLRQYENMYLSVPPEVARSLSLELQQLLGYRNHGFLGTYEGNDPRVWLRNPDAPVMPANDLFTSELEGVERIRV